MSKELKKTQKHAKEVDAKLQAGVEALKAIGLDSFVLLFWKDGDPKSQIFSQHVERMKPGHFFNLSVLGTESAAKTFAGSAGPDTPKEFGAALSLFQADLAEAVRKLDGRLRELRK